MASNYVIWKYKSVDGACLLQDLRGLDQTFRLNDGTSLIDDFPSNVTLHMNPDFQNDLLLVDNLQNSDMIVVASARLKSFIEANNLVKVEYLPISIVDHKGRTASSEYFVVHPLEPIECIDENLSEYRVKRSDPDIINRIAALTLDENLIPENRSLFRLKRFWVITLVRRDLADAITAAGFTGVEFLELSNYPEYY